MEQYARQFKALGQETRLAMVFLLRERDLCVCQLERALGLRQTAVSRHLAVLRHAGIVRAGRRGVWMHYALNRDNRLLLDYLARLLRADAALARRISVYSARAGAVDCEPPRTPKRNK